MAFSDKVSGCRQEIRRAAVAIETARHEAAMRHLARATEPLRALVHEMCADEDFSRMFGDGVLSSHPDASTGIRTAMDALHPDRVKVQFSSRQFEDNPFPADGVLLTMRVDTHLSDDVVMEALVVGDSSDVVSESIAMDISQVGELVEWAEDRVAIAMARIMESAAPRP